ncbi:MULTISPECIES: pilus (MSHA type) biogenesis protein MshL [Methylotenera]|uniref:pilus (MSHA type) biogenesis protein MshL n=1 Tax=Methylotenera TaxID=359407 RepID=UPI000380B1BA|nr:MULTISPECIES: pilus (MSHA type) biogenesis protein MshL [Methylotenera]
MLSQNNKFKRLKFGFLSAIYFIVAGCAHESVVPPSKGHIDGGLTPQNPNQNSTNIAPIPKTIRNNPQLPIPKQTTKAQTYSVVVNEVPVKEILFALARESNLNIDIHPSIQGRATLNAVDQTLPAILERLAKQVDLTYRMDGNVLYIAPDQPVLRIYKVDYVNINRDTKGFIGAAAEISSTGQAASTGANGSTTITNTSGNGAKNSSSTSVDSISKNHLWESLIQNLKELLAETDKEVIVSRFGSVPESSVQNTNANTSGNSATSAATSLAEAARAATEERNQQRSEYKTLFAANVIANPETGVISVRATNKQHEKVQEFIDRVIGSAKKQVLIEATIVEVRLNDSYQAGIDWSRFGNRGTSSDGFTFQQSLGPEVNPGSIGGAGIAIGYINQMSSLGNLAASVTLLKQFGDTKVLSSPKLMVLNNQTAVLKVVDNIVYFTIQAQISQSASGVSGTNLQSFTTTPNTVPVGVVMSVTPQISDSSIVNINVRPTISRTIGPGKQDPNPQLVYQSGDNNQRTQIVSLIPEIQVREMESMLQVHSGSTAVLGGLMQDEIQRNTDGVPGLMDVPGVGNIFKGRDNLNRKTELVIFLRPTVITNASLESDELQSYKQYLPAQQLLNVLEQAN